MKPNYFGSALLALASACAQASEMHHQHAGHASDAPAGIMGDHLHAAGGWMLSYRYMGMRMEDFRDGTDDLSSDTILNEYMGTATAMPMEMHMLGLMYAPSDKMTWMLMLPYATREMDMRNRMGMAFTSRSAGIGDLKISALYDLGAKSDVSMHLNLGLSVPTGSIDERTNVVPGMDRQLMPYPMQIGSGTWDLLPGITLRGTNKRGSWGAQAIATLRTGENDRDYRLGHRLDFNAWNSWRLNPVASLSLRVRHQTWGNVEGADPELTDLLAMSPIPDPNQQGGTRTDLLGGLNLHLPAGAERMQKMGLEIGAPLYEKLDGPQMSNAWTLNFSWQMSF